MAPATTTTTTAERSRRRPPVPIAERPVGVIDLIDGAFAALRQRPATLLLCTIWLVLPGAVLAGFLQRNVLGGASLIDVIDDPTVAEEVSQSGVSGSQLVISTLIDSMVLGMAGVPVAYVIGGWVLGEDRTASQALRRFVRRAPVWLGAWLIAHLAQLIGGVLFVIPGLVVVVLTCLVSPVVALEDLGPLESVQRSRRLVSSRAGSAVGVILLLALVAYGTSTALSTAPALGAQILGPARAWPLLSLGTLLVSSVMVPINAAAMTLLYLDIRFRAEAADLDARRQVLFGGS